jgi:hypothetical protein
VGSWLVRDGASLHLVGAVLNHKDQKTTAGYAYFQTEDRQRALDRHGQAVVQVAQSVTRQQTNGGSPTEATQMSQLNIVPVIQKISRQDLYELVWSEPTTALARRFGISDVGLAKVCRRSAIPAPPRGYWAKIAAGNLVPRPGLPERAELDLKPITFRISRNYPRRDPCRVTQTVEAMAN